MKGYEFRIYMDRAGLFRWRLVARNEKVVADSGEGYSTRSNARRAVVKLLTVLSGLGRRLRNGQRRAVRVVDVD